MMAGFLLERAVVLLVLFSGCLGVVNGATHELRAGPATTHFGGWSAYHPAVLTINSGDVVRVWTVSGEPGGVPLDAWDVPSELQAVWNDACGASDGTQPHRTVPLPHCGKVLVVVRLNALAADDHTAPVLLHCVGSGEAWRYARCSTTSTYARVPSSYHLGCLRRHFISGLPPRRQNQVGCSVFFVACSCSHFWPWESLDVHFAVALRNH